METAFSDLDILYLSLHTSNIIIAVFQDHFQYYIKKYRNKIK